jgi:hypothetical protein
MVVLVLEEIGLSKDKCSLSPQIVPIEPRIINGDGTPCHQDG